MLQCYRWREAQESSTGGIKMQAAKRDTAFPKPHCSLRPDPAELQGLAISNRQQSPAHRPSHGKLRKRLRQVV